jgi:eukaryotic-like serine/threonine-protein kinase
MAEVSMTGERWLRVKELFDAALGVGRETLPAWLDDRCGPDAGLRHELETLIASHDRAGAFIEAPAILTGGAAHVIATATATPAPLQMVGRRLGSYRITGELGRGGMGVVYLADRDDDTFRKQVAIKVLGGGGHPTLAERFDAERRMLASLDHPNIARLLDAGWDDFGTPFVVMEYVEGARIDDYARARRLSTRHRLELFCTVCDAVQYSHQRLVVHRDIKPGNILVTPAGVPKLLDFGIAKLLDAQAADSQRTQTGLRALTPESASPEQVRGEPVTVASDVYSLGVLLYRLLTDRSPYRRTPTTDVEIVQSVCEEVPTKPSDAVAWGEMGAEAPGSEASPPRWTATPRELAGDLDLITIKALRKEPERRYASVERLASDVRRYLRGDPIEAAPDSWRYRAGKFIRRHPAGLASAAALLVTMGLGAGATLWQARAARVERARADRRFSDVRSLATSVIFELHDVIAPLPGSTAARELLVRRALSFLDVLAGEAGSDVSLQRELAAAYARLGEIQGGVGRANLGLGAAALASYRKSLALYERVAMLMPSDAAALDAVARAHGPVGALLDRMGEGKASLDHFQKAVAIHERLLAIRPDDARLQVALASSYEGMGDTLATLEDWPRVLDLRQRTLGLLRQAALRAPQSEGLQRSLALANKRLGAIEAKLTRYPEAVEAYRQALSVDEARLTAEPNSSEARSDVAMDVSDLAYILWKSGDRRVALAQYDRARAIREALVLADPNDARARQALSATLTRTGRLLWELGDTAQALARHGQALGLLERLARDNPTDAQMEQALAECLATIGVGFAELDRRGERPGGCRDATPFLSRSLGVYRDLTKRGLARSAAGTVARVEADLGRCSRAAR